SARARRPAGGPAWGTRPAAPGAGPPAAASASAANDGSSGLSGNGNPTVPAPSGAPHTGGGDGLGMRNPLLAGAGIVLLLAAAALVVFRPRPATGRR
ncbi:hypothetical protein ABT369_51895, partial [Dactylosporangium sp. NPDC000244]|uniref:hypothetical protein n=1 Tax=Dactylosporangium sp. NPDC000244 TaxID=3154365 RepID=UPI00332A90D6